MIHRCTRSAGRSAALSACIVRHALPCTAPCRHNLLIRHSTVQEVTGIYSRLNSRQTSGTVDLEVISPYAPNLGLKRHIGLCTRWQPFRIGLAVIALVIRRGGNRQLRANQLDPILGSVHIDKRLHHISRRPRSARAKKPTPSQILVGTIQLTVLPLQRLEPLAIRRGQTFTLP